MKQPQGASIRKLILALIIFGFLAKVPAPQMIFDNEQPDQPKVADIKPVPQTNVERPAKSIKKKRAVKKPTPKPVKVEPPKVELPKSKVDLMNLAGIPATEQKAVDYIVQKESSWNHLAVNASSGATGLCQALPASKMASVSGDYLTNPVTQLKWCHSYAHDRYGGWWPAHAFWLANAWW